VPGALLLKPRPQKELTFLTTSLCCHCSTADDCAIYAVVLVLFCEMFLIYINTKNVFLLADYEEIGTSLFDCRLFEDIFVNLQAGI
jgi:hypothetical protein